MGQNAKETTWNSRRNAQHTNDECDGTHSNKIKRTIRPQHGGHSHNVAARAGLISGMAPPWDQDNVQGDRPVMMSINICTLPG
jgi:hypothetical protein